MFVYKRIYTVMYMLSNRLFIIRTTPRRPLIRTICFKTVKKHDTNDATLLCTLLSLCGSGTKGRLICWVLAEDNELLEAAAFCKQPSDFEFPKKRREINEVRPYNPELEFPWDREFRKSLVCGCCRPKVNRFCLIRLVTSREKIATSIIIFLPVDTKLCLISFNKIIFLTKGSEKKELIPRTSNVITRMNFM